MANIELTLTPASPTGSMIFTLGAPGPQGLAGTMTVGTVTTGAPGSSATIVNVGTPNAAILDFDIPRGDVGAQGDKGDKGDQGDPGTSGVVYATAPLSYDSGTQTVSIDLSAYATQSYVTSQGFITSSALTPYLTSATAASTYQTLSGMSSYLTTSVAATTYLAKSGGVITGDIQSNNGSGYRSYDGLFNQVNVSASIIQLLKGGAGGGALSVEWDGITFPGGKQTLPFLGLAGYATEYWVTTGFAPIAAGQPVSGTVGQVLTKNSGTNYDSSWATLIPGDRYLTTSTTSLAIDNNNKTLTVGTGLSYTPQQDVVIAYDANNHMHAQVLTYNSGTGVMTVDVRSHTGTGTFAVWTVNVGGTVPAASVVWGDITGVLGNQTDLATALNGKLEVTTASSTYFTIASAAGKANLSGATFSGKLNTTVTATTAPINIGSQLTAPTTTVAGDLWIGANINYKSWDGVTKAVANTNTTNQFSQGQAITVNSASNAFRINQQGTGPALVVEDSLSPDATPFVIDANGKVGVGIAPDATAAIKVDANGIMFGDGTTQTTAATSGIPDAPLDGSTYGRNNGAWTVTSGGGIPDCPDDGYLWVRVNGSWSGPYWNQSFVVDGTTYYALVLVNP